MKALSITAASVISPLGRGVEENFRRLLEGEEGIREVDDRRFSPGVLPLALLPWQELEERFARDRDPSSFTAFEQLVLLCAGDALEKTGLDPAHPRTALVFSTTKGNVEELAGREGFSADRLRLAYTAGLLAKELGFSSAPTVISNACISGVVALIQARRMILSGHYDHVVVVGADVVSSFIVSGFESFKSLSTKACRPFDEARDGLSLGEAAAAIVLSREGGEVELLGGAISNDANHISGPSRTGEGLLLAIQKTLGMDRVPDVISAHGTATLYNDEMESIALKRAGLEGIPVNSLKGVFGHTLGAAGVLETALTAEGMVQNVFPGTRGFARHGVSGGISLSGSALQMEQNLALKTASGFGGCNAALLLKRK